MNAGVRENGQRRRMWASRVAVGLLLVSTLLGSEVLAVPACPDCTVDVTQPDGTILRLRPYGDEWTGRLVTEDGYTVVKNGDGWYYFAVLGKSGALVPSDHTVLPVSQRSIDDQQFLEETGKYIGGAISDKHSQSDESQQEFDASLVHRNPETVNNILLLLIKYPDEVNTVPVTYFDNLVNQYLFDGRGSMNDYYLEISYRTFAVTGTTVGWYTSSQNKSAYAHTNGFGAAAQLVKEAVQAAVAAGVNFAPFDNNNDGFVDGLVVVHVGPGAEAGYADYPWSHRGSLIGGGVGTVTASGKTINSFSMVPEFTSPGDPSSIGVFCHEYGHQLGLPDLYDVTLPPAPSEGVGDWCLMGAGSWLGPGGDGSCPSHLSAWCKARLGWMTPTLLTDYTLGVELLNSEKFDYCYRIWRQGVSGTEYFLLENRQKVGFDAFLPGCGIAIWHIDQSKFENGNNNDVSHKLVDLEEADGRADLDNKTNRGDNGDLFPSGTNTNFSFSDYSNPDDWSYGGVPCALNVSSQYGVCSNVMYFDFNPVYGTKIIDALFGPGGSISPNGLVEVVNGSDLTFTITPDPSYRISEVWVDGVYQGDNITSYTFTNVIQYHTIYAGFQCLPEYNPYSRKINGDQYQHNAGYSVAGIGDLNGDGKSEYIIGRPGSDAGSLVDCGSAIVYNGADGAIMYWYNGYASYDMFGWSVAGAGDVDGDGTPDFVVGAPYSNGNGPHWSGAVYVYSGSTGWLIRCIAGDQAAQHLGYSVAGVGDVTGDGKAEFIAGAPEGDAYGLVDCGLALVYTASGALYDWHYGEENNAQLGRSVAGLGDVNGDGRPDWIAGAPQASPNGISHAGSAYVYSGTGALIYKLNGEQPYHWAGTSVAGIGDVNLDGRADFIVGRPGEDAGGLTDCGNIIVYSGLEAGTYMWLNGEKSDDGFGAAVSGLGDFNNDGRPDYVVGAPWADQNCSNSRFVGAAYVYSGFNGVLLNRYSGENGGLFPADGDQFGFSVAGAGDVNGDGGADVIVGAPYAEEAQPNPSDAGSAYIYLGKVSPPNNIAVTGYEASSHMRPDQFYPAWIQQTGGGASAPVLSGDSLVISTSSNAQNAYYVQLGQGYLPAGDIAIEFRMKYVSGSTANSTDATAMVGFSRGNGWHNYLAISYDEVFLWSSEGVRGPTANVDTHNSFHTYRVEVDVSGGIRVFRDGVLILSQALIYHSSYTTPMIWWGDGGDNAYGVSKWTYFKYNTMAPTTCCVDRVGNANGQGEYPDEVTLGDIMLMVDAKFISGDCSKLPCIAEADVNQDGGANPNCDDHVTLGDIMTLVDFLFISGPDVAVLPDCL